LSSNAREQNNYQLWALWLATHIIQTWICPEMNEKRSVASKIEILKKYKSLGVTLS
jgi:hypothetical protein